jgi:hypothetical protein
LTKLIDIGIFKIMIARDGTIKEVKISRAGDQAKVGRLIYLEPALWDMMERLGKMANKTRSTFIRCELKDHRYLPKIEGIDWSESNIQKQ